MGWGKGAQMAEHQIITVMRAHLRLPECTEQSVGALYALFIAARLPTEHVIAVHDAMEARFATNSADEWIKCLDRIKVIGWRLYDAVVEEQKAMAKKERANG